MTETRDRWAEWLAVRRFGGDPATRQRFLAQLSARRDKVLDLARLAEGETLLDVGCGEGLIAFGALERGAARVIFSDISDDLLAFCREAAADLGLLDRCEFVNASADKLDAIADSSVDVVTTRSVLIYVADKRTAFAEFARVLRPGERISLFEPINRFALRTANTWAGYDLAPLGDIGDKLRAVYETLQPRDSDPMLDFDERDLIHLAEETGFFPIELYLDAEIKPAEPRAWEGFLNSSGNPNIPTIAEAIEQALTPAEREHLVTHLRPTRRAGTRRVAHGKRTPRGHEAEPMTAESAYLQALARRVVTAAVERTPLRPALLTGSAGRGNADRFSTVRIGASASGFDLTGSLAAHARLESPCPPPSEGGPEGGTPTRLRRFRVTERLVYAPIAEGPPKPAGPSFMRSLRCPDERLPQDRLTVTPVRVVSPHAVDD
ncbi:MAG TPA: methyltransferase domain-containing protein [Gaiellaceae bacterium]|nr:methyltransferase domain-containing protein [Gaiellaceae bacterium]